MSTALKIESTKEYSKFKIDDLNRDISEKHVQGLIASISQKNLLHLYPIIVSEDFNVRDGQHRLVAANALGVDIYYIVSDDMVIEDVANANRHSLSWQLVDYLDHWAKMGLSDYIRLKVLNEQYPEMSPSTMFRIASKDGGGFNAHHAFRAGEFYFSEQSEHKVRTVAELAVKLREFTPHIMRRGYIGALARMVQHEDFQEERLLLRASTLRARLYAAPSTLEALAVLTDVYNYRFPGGNKLTF